jgi:hypothetical protein
MAPGYARLALPAIHNPLSIVLFSYLYQPDAYDTIDAADLGNVVPSAKSGKLQVHRTLRIVSRQYMAASSAYVTVSSLLIADSSTYIAPSSLHIAVS